MKQSYIYATLIICVSLLALTGCTKPKETTNNDGAVAVPVELDEGHTEELEVTGDSVYLDMRNADFTHYDGTVLSGPEVREALSNYRNSNIAVLVATQMVIDGTIEHNKLDGNVEDTMPTAGVSGITDAVATTGEDLSDKLTFINYGALLKDGGDGVMLELKDGYLLAKSGLIGGKEVNLNDGKATKDGFSENIADYLHMKSLLVKDADGSVIGIAFYAVSNLNGG